MNATARGTIELDDASGVRGTYTFHKGEPGLATDSVDAIITELRTRYGDALVYLLNSTPSPSRPHLISHPIYDSHI